MAQKYSFLMFFLHRSSSLLRSHEHVHSEELKYKCDQCDRAFAWDSSLRMHKISTHVEERHYKCDICEASFKHNYILKKHKKRHMGGKNQRCGVCGKLFMFTYQLIEHSNVHDIENNHTCICDVCEQQFSTRSSLLRHQRRQHPDEFPKQHEPDPFPPNVILYTPSRKADKISNL